MRFIFFIFFCFCLTAGTEAQTFFKTYQATGHNQYFSTVQLKPNLFVTSGFGYVSPQNGTDALVAATDSNGTMLWSNRLNKAGDENFIYVAATTTGFIACGETFAHSNQRGDAIITRFDTSGAAIWSKYFGDTLYDIAYSVEQTSDGGFIVCGLTESLPLYNYDAFLLKLDALGNTQWQKRIGSPTIDHAVSVRQTSDGGYVFSGKSMAQSPGLSDSWLVRTNNLGDTIWTTLVGGPGWDEGMSVREYANGFMVCGGSNSFGAANYDYILYRTDPNGFPMWFKTYGGVNVEASYCLLPVSNGWMMAGYTETYGPGHNQRVAYSPYDPPQPLGTDSANALIIRTNLNGDTIWSRSYGDTKKEECFGIIPNGNGFMFTGYTESFGADSTDGYLVKIDSLGNAGCHEKISHPVVTSRNAITKRFPFTVSTSFAIDTVSGEGISAYPVNTATQCAFSSTNDRNDPFEFSVFPNPFADNFTIQVPEIFYGKQIQIRIVNLLGQTVDQRSLVAGGSISIHPQFSGAGLYPIIISCDEKFSSETMVKISR